LNESLAADVAFVWTFARVDSHVTVEFSAVLEGTSAHIALMKIQK
jgi:hypothetical protein